MKPLAITGIGIYTSFGAGIARNWQQLIQGYSGVKRITRFPTTHLPVTIAATIDLNPHSMTTLNILTQDVLAQAILHSQLQAHDVEQAQIILASSPREVIWQDRFATWLDESAKPRYRNIIHSYLHYELQQQYGLLKIPMSLITACSSGSSAIQLAADQILSGQTTVGIAIGTESSVMPETIARFALLTALSTANEIPQAASKPFSADRDGFVIGEGAAALVLEDLAFARKRGAPILAYLVGCGDTTDNYHRTRSHPSGEKIVSCMQKALESAHILPTAVDYINAHGTGTPENDKMEGKGIQILFSDHCEKLLVSSNKSMIGHTLSAAGAIEAVFSIMTLQEQIVPPTINYQQPDPDIPLNVVPNQAIEAKVDIVLSNSFGFGGQNVSLVFAKAEE